jgi:hypothetical protein
MTMITASSSATVLAAPVSLWKFENTKKKYTLFALVRDHDDRRINLVRLCMTCNSRVITQPKKKDKINMFSKRWFCCAKPKRKARSSYAVDASSRSGPCTSTVVFSAPVVVRKLAKGAVIGVKN